MNRRGDVQVGFVAAAKQARRDGVRTTLLRFRREEDGSLLIFGLFCFVMMLLLAGAALDLMRFEERRTTLQNTLDRAVLAAADLNQTLAPKDVVRDYFLKAGLNPPDPDDIVVNQGNFGEWRTVSATIEEEMDTWFMNMMGIPTLMTPASGEAEERVGQVEISLVLDVSGSMNSNSRLVNLKPAAKQFVDTMFDSVEPGKLSLSIVTYATQSSIGPDLMGYFDNTNEHDKSYCLHFDDEGANKDFDTTAITLSGNGRTYQRAGHFDPFDNEVGAYYWACHATRNFDIQPFSGDRDGLKAFIDNLQAAGNTSIDVGMKWGAALLDPSMAPVVDDMIADNKLPFQFADRPYPFIVNGKKNKDALKVIVVMTDGANTTEYRLKPQYDEGTSIIRGNTSYVNSTSNTQYSVWSDTMDQWYIIARSMWRDEAWGDGQYQSCTSKGVCTWVNDPGDSYPMTWQEVWERHSMYWLADNVIRRAFGDSARAAWRPSGSEVVQRINTVKDDRTKRICSAAKNLGVTIFSIGFEAPTAGQKLLRDCASSPAHFYAVQGLDISTAFAAIASSINKLRLTN